MKFKFKKVFALVTLCVYLLTSATSAASFTEYVKQTTDSTDSTTLLSALFLEDNGITEKNVEIYAPESVDKGLQEEIRVLIRNVEPDYVYLYYKSNTCRDFSRSKMDTEENKYFRYVLSNSFTQGDYVEYYIGIEKDSKEMISSVGRIDVLEKFYIHAYLEQFSDETLALFNELIDIKAIPENAKSLEALNLEGNLNNLLENHKSTISKEVESNLYEIVNKLNEVSNTPNIRTSHKKFEDISRFNYMYNGRSLGSPANPANPRIPGSNPVPSWPDVTSANNRSRNIVGATSPHRGIDLGMALNNNVYPLYEGVINSSHNGGTEYESVVVRSVINGVDVYVRYTHISKNENLNVNSNVDVNTVLGKIREYGNNQNHLHVSLEIGEPYGLELPHERFFRNISLANGTKRNAEHITKSSLTNYNQGKIVYEVLPGTISSATLYYTIGNNSTVYSRQGTKSGYQYTFTIPLYHSDNVINYLVETNRNGMISTKPAKYDGAYANIFSNRPQNNFSAYYQYSFYYPKSPFTPRSINDK